MMTTTAVPNDADATTCVQAEPRMILKHDTIILDPNMSTTSTFLGWKSTYLPEWREFVCGCGAAVTNITITYPINKLIFRQMLHGVNAHSALKELHSEGLYFLYRGMLPPLLQKSLSLSVMFGVYDEVKRPLENNNVNTYVARTVAAVVAGSIEAIFTPFERVQTLLADSTYHKTLRNTYDAFRTIGLKHGIGEYYRGVHAILLRNGPANACFFILREELQCVVPCGGPEFIRNLVQFICGATIGATVSCLFYPLNVAKVALQSKIGGKYETLFTVLPRIYRERGSKLRLVYRGVQVNCTRSFISWGIMNVAYENIKKLLY